MVCFRRTLICIAAIAGLQSFAGAAQEDWTRPAEVVPAGSVLSLNDCIALALRNQPTLREAQAQVEVQRGLVAQTRSGLLPGATVTGSAPVATGRRSSSGVSVTVGASQLLFDFGRSSELLRQAQRLETASAYGVNASRGDVVYNVKAAYYTLLRTSRLVQVYEENLRAQNAHVQEAQTRQTVGVAPRSDVLKAEAAAASASVDLVNARNDAEQARADLNETMGIDLRSATRICETSEPESATPDQETVVAMALAGRPEVSQAIEQIAASEAGLKSARTGNLPVVTTSVSDQQFLSGSSDGRSNTWAWYINLEMNPFDSGLTRGRVIQSQAEVSLARESLYAVRQTVSRDAVSARLSLLASQEALAAATSEVASATEDLGAARGRYQAGVGIFLEILDAQAALLKAQVDEAVARYGLSIARAQLERAVGGASRG